MFVGWCTGTKLGAGQEFWWRGETSVDTATTTTAATATATDAAVVVFDDETVFRHTSRSSHAVVIRPLFLV